MQRGRDFYHGVANEWSPYFGYPMHGLPILTMVRGEHSSAQPRVDGQGGVSRARTRIADAAEERLNRG
jgi:hypothetical protein